MRADPLDEGGAGLRVVAESSREGDVIAIPKAAGVAHVRENRGAADIRLTKRDLGALDESFPSPTYRMPIEVR